METPSAFRINAMSGFDYEKEVISYYKLWLGVLLVTDISLIGWYVNNYHSVPQWIEYGCIILVLMVSGYIVLLSSSTERLIIKLKRQ